MKPLGRGKIIPGADAMASAAFEDIADTFEFLEDWEERYRHVIEMGKQMPALDAAFKVPALKVEGCASQVWLRPVVEGTGPGAVFDFEGESDAILRISNCSWRTLAAKWPRCCRSMPRQNWRGWG